MKSFNQNVQIVLNFFGKNKFKFINLDNFEPTYTSIRKIYPKNIINIFSDIDVVNNKNDRNLKIYKIKSFVSINNSRYGYRSSDYYRCECLKYFKNKIIIYLDLDFEILSKEFKVIEVFAKDYGMTMASNPRLTDRVERRIGSDVIMRKFKKSDKAKGLGFAYCNGLFAIDTSNKIAMSAIRFFLQQFKKKPERGPTVLYNTFRLKKFNPYILPPQWCLSGVDILNGKHIFEDPIVFHLNNSNIKKAYKNYLLIKKIKNNKFVILIISILKKIKRQLWN